MSTRRWGGVKLGLAKPSPFAAKWRGLDLSDREHRVQRLRNPSSESNAQAMPAFYEFFAGGGMARCGLGPGWTCLFANDFDARKTLTYRANWGTGDELKVADVATLTPEDLPGQADLVWGSFPCQDLSLAGAGAGLSGSRSGTFHPFWALMRGLIAQGRAPKVIALENVCGALTARDGRDFRIIRETFAGAGYRLGALVIDAALFAPQSRPRLFLVGVRAGLVVAPSLTVSEPTEPFHGRALISAIGASAPGGENAPIWWALPPPRRRNTILADLIEDEPVGVRWHTEAQTRRLLSLMSDIHLAKLEAAKAAGRRVVGGLYRRTRTDGEGVKRQRAEVRFDDMAGCLRTPSGGSSRQTIVVVDGPLVRTRLISPRETARLMGLPDDYLLPTVYDDAYHLTGDGVSVDVVRHLARHLLEPLVQSNQGRRAAA